MTTHPPHPASFRDPKGHVFLQDGEVYRTINACGRADYEAVKATGLLNDLISEGLLIAATPAPAAITADCGDDMFGVLHHPRIPFISHPYEWSFHQLQDAALLHLDVQLKALEKGVALSDASAYNIQFLGARPVFIDHLSFTPYVEGQIWSGHKQFCDQFLNPLLLTAYRGVPFNAIYRGAIEGIDASVLSPLLPWTSYFNFKTLSHVHLLAKFQNNNTASSGGKQAHLKKARLSRLAFAEILKSLRRWIASLNPKASGQTQWGGYDCDTSYNSDEAQRKAAFVRRFHSSVQPKILWDTGANNGAFAAIALQAGAKYVVGFEQDHGALNKAYARSKAEGLAFLPLYGDLLNPTPSQGFGEVERGGLLDRAPADAVQALAVIHHLAIGRNVPLDRLIDWYLALAPQGLLEFVPKADPMVQKLFAFRDDIFPNYTVEAFRHLLSQKAQIVEEAVITPSGRTLFWFKRA